MRAGVLRSSQMLLLLWSRATGRKGGAVGVKKVALRPTAGGPGAPAEAKEGGAPASAIESTSEASAPKSSAPKSPETKE